MRPALLLLLLLPACVPVPLPQAEEQCAVSAATGRAPPGGTVSVGVGTGTGWNGWNGSGAAVGMTFGGPTWPRLPPETVYVNCVRDRTGQDPTVNMSTALKRATAQ